MNDKRTILVVEDEPAIAESVAYALRREGFDTDIAATYRSACAKLGAARLVILDLMLPDGNGLDVIAALRAQPQPAAVIVLSSRDSETDRIAALEGGADDYVTKPFSPREVVARVRAVLRRAESKYPEPRQAEPAGSPLRTNAATRRAYFHTVELELTRVEFDLLAQLVEVPGHVLGRQELIDRVWGDGFAITDRTIDSHIKSLRRKVVGAGGSAQLIETVRGVGYRVRLDPETSSDDPP